MPEHALIRENISQNKGLKLYQYHSGTNDVHVNTITTANVNNQNQIYLLNITTTDYFGAHMEHNQTSSRIPLQNHDFTGNRIIVKSVNFPQFGA